RNAMRLNPNQFSPDDPRIGEKNYNKLMSLEPDPEFVNNIRLAQKRGDVLNNPQMGQDAATTSLGLGTAESRRGEALGNTEAGQRIRSNEMSLADQERIFVAVNELVKEHPEYN